MWCSGECGVVVGVMYWWLWWNSGCGVVVGVEVVVGVV